ncbi:MAG: tyrosine--tRNA ligase [Candidatus Omnitrophica bacterium]|nr:tyrosine--tRNA ligase [Candidatus Omnitrophota bacterium]
MEKSIDKQLGLISRGSVEVIQLDELKKKLERAIKENKPLVIKAGFDPTAPDIHLGHTVLLRKLKHFQQLGHKVIFLIGDATALVGDPSGQSLTRKTLTWDEVEKNAKTYEKQVSKILDTHSASSFERKHNSAWFSAKSFGFDQFVELAQKYTVARLLERDDFEKRLNENKPISFLELFYPLMQGYDSVMLKSDVEIGGSDQKFNMLVGRDLQQAYSQEAQVVLTMPILEGLDGINKMSKSLGNYIGINEPAKDMFGKVMSISDELMYKYYELLTDEDVAAIKADVQSGALHPKTAKVNLAKMIVTQYHSKAEADKQAEEFDRAFKDKGFPQDIPLQEIADANNGSILSVLAEGLKILSSRGEAKRKIQEGAVEVNGSKVSDINFRFETGKEYRVRVGKKFARLILKKS